MIRSITVLVLLGLGAYGAQAQDKPPSQCPAVQPPPRSTVKPSPANPQYVIYNGRTQALVGASASYLCHIDQPGSFGNPSVTPSMDYCAFNNYRDYLDYLRRGLTNESSIPTVGLNTFRLWIGLNHSPGTMRRGTPYDHETPFQTPYDTNGAPDEWFFARLKCVLDDAWARDMIVEVTLFDPWEGDADTSPWRVFFGANKSCFASKDFVLPNGSTCATDPETRARHRAGWDKQKQLITELVTRLCRSPNLYYELANEVDLTGGSLQAGQIATWHQEMAEHLITEETRQGCGHFLAANLHEPALLDSLPASFKVINAHYTALSDARLGANELLRTRHNGASGGPAPDRVFGFNETKVTSLISLRDDPHFQSADAARAEAWEFLLSEGGIYDLYVERWQSPPEISDTPNAVSALKIVNGLLSAANLERVQRSPSVDGALPAWISARSSLQPYGTNNTRWGAMHSPMTLAGDANFLYIHRSLLEAATTFQRYAPQIRSASDPYPAETIYVNLPTGTYRAEWIEPSSGILRGSEAFQILKADQPALVPAAPKYMFDVALRITWTGAPEGSRPGG